MKNMSNLPIVEPEKIRHLAEGKIACQCGNQDWQQFLYVGAGFTQAAGCKHCGCVYHLEHGTEWNKILDGPGGPKQ